MIKEKVAIDGNGDERLNVPDVSKLDTWFNTEIPDPSFKDVPRIREHVLSRG